MSIETELFLFVGRGRGTVTCGPEFTACGSLPPSILLSIPTVMSLRCAVAWVLTLACVALRAAAGQGSYYNLDSGRPARVEDALATPRGELEIQLLPLRGEWVGNGTERFRVEPKLSYGILPMTEIELRVPVLYVRGAGSAATTGIASAGVGALHAFNVETRWPALALCTAYASAAVMPG